MLYKDNGRKMVLALKHGDRHEVARLSAVWLEAAVKDILPEGELIVVPVPLHWSRLLKRTYNQSALLADALGRRIHRPVIPDLLVRTKRTCNLDGLGRDERFAELQKSIEINPSWAEEVADLSILIVDDVMTSGATLAASAQACMLAAAKDVITLTLARVVKDA